MRDLLLPVLGHPRHVSHRAYHFKVYVRGAENHSQRSIRFRILHLLHDCLNLTSVFCECQFLLLHLHHFQTAWDLSCSASHVVMALASLKELYYHQTCPCW